MILYGNQIHHFSEVSGVPQSSGEFLLLIASVAVS